MQKLPCVLSYPVGDNAALANYFTAAIQYVRFVYINHWQAADRAFTRIAALRLLEQ